MAFADCSPRTLLVGEGEARLTLTQAVATGDLVGINATNGWVKAKGAATAVKALFVAGEQGAVGSVITVFRRALLRAAYAPTSAQIGAALYLSDTAGAVATSAGSVTQVVGYIVNATDIALEIRSPLALDASDIANDTIDSAHYVAGSIDLEHMSAESVDSDQYVDGSIDTAHIAAKQVTKAKVADEVVQDEVYMFSGSVDNQTVKLVKLRNAGTVVACTYFTGAALGSSVGIDVVDGGAAGTGTDVICSCTDNLSGVEVEDTFAAHKVLAAGDYINITFDDFTSATLCIVTIVVEVKANATT